MNKKFWNWDVFRSVGLLSLGAFLIFISWINVKMAGTYFRLWTL